MEQLWGIVLVGVAVGIWKRCYQVQQRFQERRQLAWREAFDARDLAASSRALTMQQGRWENIGMMIGFLAAGGVGGYGLMLLLGG